MTAYGIKNNFMWMMSPNLDQYDGFRHSGFRTIPILMYQHPLPSELLASFQGSQIELYPSTPSTPQPQPHPFPPPPLFHPYHPLPPPPPHPSPPSIPSPPPIPARIHISGYICVPCMVQLSHLHGVAINMQCDAVITRPIPSKILQ